MEKTEAYMAASAWWLVGLLMWLRLSEVIRWKSEEPRKCPQTKCECMKTGVQKLLAWYTLIIKSFQKFKLLEHKKFIYLTNWSQFMILSINSKFVWQRDIWRRDPSQSQGGWSRKHNDRQGECQCFEPHVVVEVLIAMEESPLYWLCLVLWIVFLLFFFWGFPWQPLYSSLLS